MIWNLNITPESAKSAVVAHITAEINEVCGDDLTLDPSKIEELAKAVESYVQGEHDGVSADSRYLVMLASKALTSLGEGTAGRRLLVFGTGLVKPSEWEVTGEDAIWILDLKEMMINEAAPLELIFFSSLAMVIESIAEVWDGTRGQGVLGVKNVLVTALAILGNDSSSKRVASLGAEIKSVCEKKLDQLGRERTWDQVPRVMNLDI